MRREGRPSEEAILLGRMIDRSIRPLFDLRMRRDVQVNVTILSLDEETEPDFISLFTAATALAVSDIPWAGPISCMRFLKSGDAIVMNPTYKQLEEKWEFHGFAAGTKDRINMIELEGIEAGEPAVVKALDEAQKEIAKLISFQEKIVKEIGKPKRKVPLADLSDATRAEMRRFLGKKLDTAVYIRNKTEQSAAIESLRGELENALREKGVEEKELENLDYAFDEEIDILVHKNILESEKRPDGRKLDEVRELDASVALFKRNHGSSLFIRGTTQALAITTLAPPGAEQLIETIEFSGKRHFMLHYNFPAYSVGETGPSRGPGRREIGHGALAKKAIQNMLPSKDEFPYTIRVVAETLSSNGSSSMATTCAASLSLMDAGVKIKKPVAGIAMGLMTDEILDNKGKYKILTDLQGPEDHHGDMDFKVAGTDTGVTAIQLDVKIGGLTNKMIAETLDHARKARLEILKVMAHALPAPRPELSPYAPVVLVIMIDPTKIGYVIGPDGKVINGIIERTKALSIDIEQTGKVCIAGKSKEEALAAYKEVEGIVKEYAIGEMVSGKVVRILEFGAIVEFGPGRDGMIHVSELRAGFVKKVEDVVKLGDTVRAKIIKMENGKIGLSLKGVEQKL